MNKFLFLIMTAFCVFNSSSLLQANGGGCARCDEIREQNKQLVNDFTYYEEFVEKHPDQARPVEHTQEELKK